VDFHPQNQHQAIAAAEFVLRSRCTYFELSSVVPLRSDSCFRVEMVAEVWQEHPLFHGSSTERRFTVVLEPPRFGVLE